MARANRHYIPHCVWHITHRCHKKEFLLKFAKDKNRWMTWLYEAKKRFGLRVLNYVVTSNHIHLLVLDRGEDVIPNSLQLIAGRTAQEFNQRKKRKGAFWEDRYHATAIDADEHLVRCLVYMDLNMVRAGVVKHPAEWPFGGYQEIQHPPDRYSRIDIKALMKLCGIPDEEKFRILHRQWVEEGLEKSTGKRGACWSESVAVGNEKFVRNIQEQLGYRGKERRVRESEGGFELRESVAPYNGLFGVEKGALSPENDYIWDV
jgi:REP element-mobilizing transposase RayT